MKNRDIIQVLLSIYDTKEVFIKELQVLLSQRLLDVKSYDTDKEVNIFSASWKLLQCLKADTKCGSSQKTFRRIRSPGLRSYAQGSRRFEAYRSKSSPCHQCKRFRSPSNLH